MRNKFNIFINIKKINHLLYSWDLSYNGIKYRIGLVLVFFIFCFIAVSFRLINISTDVYNKNNYFKNVNHFRNEIIDRNGHIVAISLPSSSLFAKPHDIINKEETIQKLISILPDLNVKVLKEKLNSNKSFVWIKYDITPKEQEDIKKLGLVGVGFEHKKKRIYPLSNLLSHVIGYTGVDGNGLAGIEKKYDDYLTNNHNSKLQLSIDTRLQEIVSDELDIAIKKHNAKGGSVIIVDPNNGEILSLVSKPDFNPHFPSKADSTQLFNTVTQGVYEFGSVFKALTIAIGLDSKAITIHDAYDLSNLKIGKFNVKDYKKAHGWHSIGKIFLQSSNIGTSQIILDIGSAKFKKYLKELKLLDVMQLELPEKAYPLFPNQDKLSDLTLATMSYGYGLSISAMHFVQAMIPVVNGGYLYNLTLLKQDIKPEAIQVLKSETSEEMRKLLRLAVAQGTAKKADVKGYLVGGKTGTANKVLPNGKYAQDNRRSSFIGVVHAHDPKYLIYITLDEPKGTAQTFGFATGGWTAAPLAGNIISKMCVLYGIEAIDDDDYKIHNMLHIDYSIDQEI